MHCLPPKFTDWQHPHTSEMSHALAVQSLCPTKQLNHAYTSTPPLLHVEQSLSCLQAKLEVGS